MDYRELQIAVIVPFKARLDSQAVREFPPVPRTPAITQTTNIYELQVQLLVRLENWGEVTQHQQ